MYGNVDRQLDVSGDVCPLPFVKAKLMLESMAPGQLLRLVVDYRPAFESVPLSLALEGHEVLWAGAVGHGPVRVLDVDGAGAPGSGREGGRDGDRGDARDEGPWEIFVRCRR